MRRRQVLRGLATGLAAGPLGACGAAERLASLPEKLRSTASFHGLPANTRIVLDTSDDDRLARTAVVALRRELDYAGRSGVKDLPPAVYLAISGGGENGAYGAGVLTAWSELGTRPVFKAVTGVSTGALIAPFAFLGSAYDKDLERFYTTIDKSRVMVSRGLISGVLGDSLYDSTPLLRTIRSALTPELVAAIGQEYAEKGRLLFVATTNLDVPVGVLWNISAIAASGNKDAPETEFNSANMTTIFDSQEASPQHRLVGGTVFLYTQKTGTPVRIPLPVHVREALESLPGGDYFFWSGNGVVKSAIEDLRRGFYALAELAKVQHAHFHRLRDSFAIGLLEKGVPIESVSVLLGHTDVRITSKHYRPWVKSLQDKLEADVRSTWS